MVNDTDELELYIRGYTKSFVDYGLAQAYFKDGKTSEARDFLTVANTAKEQFKLEFKVLESFFGSYRLLIVVRS